MKHAAGEFRSRLLNTLRALQPVLSQPEVLVVGSEVPNLLEPNMAATLVVSQDVDIGVPVASHAGVKAQLSKIGGFRPAEEEPSVLLPLQGEMLEVNFVGIDPTIQDSAQTYLIEDPELPLLVFGPLGLLRPGPEVVVDDLHVPLPQPAGLIIEKLLTDRSGEKGGRDLLVVVALLQLDRDAKLAQEVESLYRRLSTEQRYLVCSNLTLLSLLEPHAGMPDPRPHRLLVAHLLEQLEHA